MIEIVIKNMFGLKVHTTQSGNTILKALQENYIDWMHACGMKGRCTTCKVNIISGSERLEEPTLSEKRFFQKGQLQEGERLTCQAKVTNGRVEIEVPDRCKLPHVDYSY
ncbi:MAG: 2Fe-2S iron-sulfur cluster-binding protein [Bacteroidota bacterium]